jgi:diacylglycerol kinase (ATP)
MKKRNSIVNRLYSIRYAIEGLPVLMKEPNAKIHAAATIVVVVAGIATKLDAYRWMALVFAITIVWVAEAMNTAIERFCDLVADGQQHPSIKAIKDVAAAGVLIAAMASIVIAFFVFFYS